MSSLSIVMPVYNEDQVIESLVRELEVHVAERLPEVELVVVDDCSTDATASILDRLAREREWLVVEHASRNAGHGPSVVRGLRMSRGEWIFQLDSDGQFEVADFWKLWEARTEADLVLGVRVDRSDPLHRLVLSRIIALAVSVLARRRLRDPNVPFRLVRRELWDGPRAVALAGDPRAVDPGRPRRGRQEVAGCRDPRPALAADKRHVDSALARAGLVQPARVARAARVPPWAEAQVGEGTERCAGGDVTEFHDGALADAAPAARLPARARWTQVRVAFGRYELVFAAVLGIALAARVVDLTAKPFHHDESEHAWFAWRLVSGHGYEYNPVFHGPVQFYVISLLYWLIGAGDVAARLAPALVGTALIGLPYLLRRQVGSRCRLRGRRLLLHQP